MTITLLLLVALLAFANGSNDNSKGVATLVGFGAAKPLPALVYATLATAIGGAVSFFLAGGRVDACVADTQCQRVRIQLRKRQRCGDDFRHRQRRSLAQRLADFLCAWLDPHTWDRSAQALCAGEHPARHGGRVGDRRERDG